MVSHPTSWRTAVGRIEEGPPAVADGPSAWDVPSGVRTVLLCWLNGLSSGLPFDPLRKESSRKNGSTEMPERRRPIHSKLVDEKRAALSGAYTNYLPCRVHLAVERQW